MANWEVSRRPLRQSGPALLVILAVGSATLALAQFQSWQRSAHDQAAFAAGAPVRVDLASAEPLAGVTGITRLPGVTGAMPVGMAPAGSGDDELLAVSGPQAAGTVQLRPDLSAQVPAVRLWSYLDRQQGSLPGLPIPGRPERLAIAVSLAGGLDGQLGPVSATVTIQDRYGLAYQLPTGSIPADGTSHRLVVPLGAASGIAYPLRLLGIQVSYEMPVAPTTVRARAADNQAVLTIRSVAASPARAGPFKPAFAAGRQLARWRVLTAAPGLDDLGATSGGAKQPHAYGAVPAGQSLAVTFDPGNGPARSSDLVQESGTGGLAASITLVIQPPKQGVPVLATSSYLRTNGVGRGSSVPIQIGGTDVAGHVALTVAAFPTVTSGGAIVADQAALQDALVSAGGAPLPATSWWLRTRTGRPPAGLPAGASLVDTAALRNKLVHDPVSAAPIKAALAVAVAAAVLAALGFCVSVAASARDRRGQRALLAALGVAAGEQARLFCLEELIISVPAAVTGVVLGIVLSHLLIPAITLTATAGLPVPPVLVEIPVVWVTVIAVGVPLIPAVAAIVSSIRQPDPAAALRAVEAAG